MTDRNEILSEIRRLAEKNGGQAPGARLFTTETGISQGQWYGVHWARWSDALKEAGCNPNEKQNKLNSQDVLQKVALFALELGHIPTNPEMKMKRRRDASFPNPKTVTNHFGSKSSLISALRNLASNEEAYSHLFKMTHILPIGDADSSKKRKTADGWVYLLKSGNHFKIGRGEQLERRVKQISIALPDTSILEHAIRTDDPSGIEAYWHRRFAEKRLNGEWFKLDLADVAAFKRRKFQ